jgi:uncharacterized protein (TIGR04255 family)
VPHYTKAPIVEAMVDIRARLPSDTVVKSMADLFSDQVRDFQDPSPLTRGFFEFKLEAGNRPDLLPTKVEDFGYVLKSADSRDVVQVRQNGFSFSRLPPYERWETFRDKCRRLWDVYRTVSKPEAITGISLRYLNRLDIPLPMGDFKDYFRTVPEVAPGLPQSLAGFFMQLQIPCADPPAMLVLTQTMVPPPTMGLVSVALDINLTIDNDFSNDEDRLWSVLGSFRDRKNEVFESCLTEKARELVR